MTLTLEEVRNIRFPMARKPAEDGYRASAVDNFIDRLEISYAKLIDDNKALQAQVSQGGGGSHDDSELRKKISKLESETQSLRAERDKLGSQLSELKGREGSNSSELASARSQASQLENELEKLRGENTRLQTALTDANGRIDSLVNAQKAHSNEQRGARDKQNAELESFRKANSDLQNQVSELKAQLETAKASAGAVPPITPHEGTLVVTTTAEASPAVVQLVANATALAEAAARDGELRAQQAREEGEVDAQRMRDEAQSEADRMVNEAIASADALSQEITQEAERVQREANENAERITREANENAERISREAHSNAQRVTSEAQERADRLTDEVNNRRNELFHVLEEERDTFAGKLAALRDYEEKYRTSLSRHLQGQLDTLNNLVFSPKNTPTVLDEDSATPRLDALLAENQRSY